MNLIFFGTNYDGAYFLQKLINKYDIKIVTTDLITNDNWRKSLKRYLLKRRLTEDIARWKSRIVLLDQTIIGKKKFKDILKEYNIDLGIVATFGKIIPKDVIESIPLGIINVHSSLLPKYRGANPIFWAIRNGEKEFGITAHYLNERIDEGDIILQKKIPIEDYHTIVDCKKIFFKEGVSLLKKVINMFSKGRVEAFPQDNDKATYYPPAKYEYRTIHIEEHSYTEIRNIIRASMDRGGAIFWDNSKKLLVKSISEVLLKRGRFIEVHVKNRKYFLQY